MLFDDTYKTIKEATEANLREKGSKFLGYAYPVVNETEVKEYIQVLKKKYPDATHHCYAYILGAGKEISRANDDGEPSNTAGKPIQRAIQSAGLTNTLIVVVRYFGGTLLGVPGLINAYGNCAKLTIDVAEIIEKIVEESYMVTCDYDKENEVFKLFKVYDAKIINIEKYEQVKVTFSIRKSNASAMYDKLSKVSGSTLSYEGLK
ncbi:MAG: YigZ family protein [Bacteroidetes bacterium]|nr:YigZ family protein [Bacteroidota bacterium]